MLALACALGVPRVRLGRNAVPLRPLNRLYKTWLNRRIRRAGLAGTTWMGTAADLERLRKSGVADADDFEVVTHPGFVDGRLVLDI